MSTSPNSRSGLDLRWRDDQIRPQDDLFGHVNGKWLDSHEIPDDRASDGSFRALHDRAQEDVLAIIDEAESLDGGEARMIADLYASFMDDERADSLGWQPVAPLLETIASASDKDALAIVLGRLQRQELAALVGAYVSPDAKDSTRYVFHLTQSGLGLPDESYYSDDSHAELRQSYTAHLERMASLFERPQPYDFAQTVMAMETAIASASWDRVSNRDADKTYTLMTTAELRAHAPQFPWSDWLTACGAAPDAIDELVVRQPSFVADIAALWNDRSLDEWKTWLSAHVMTACASYLSSDIVEEKFDFHGRTLSGTPQIRERWRRGVAVVESTLGEAIGKLYVARHFAPESKERMVELVDNLIEAYRRSIENLDWMGAETRDRAIEKLRTFTPKIGYPDKWKDYSSLDIRRDDILGNMIRAAEWSTDDDLAKLGRPIDKDEWFLTPQTVNAYYNPRFNEIVFPAAILQPPFFDPEADAAANYGGIGAVIGHEIGHGFDDQGSKYDGAGNLVDWWQEADRTEFAKRARALIEQYDGLSPAALPGNMVNGALTVGENIGDLGGLTIAIKAYEISLDGAEAPVIDGLTGMQRVLIAWAQIWRGKYRKEEALRLLTVDPHSPPDLRCNAIVSNLDTFHDHFGVTEGDRLFKPAGERVRIW